MKADSLLYVENRDDWIDAGLSLLTSGWQTMLRLDSGGRRMIPPMPQGCGYPKPGDPAHRHRAAEFEAVVRTLYIAAPLLRNDATLEINGLSVATVYHELLERLTDPAYADRLPLMEELNGLTVQQTCEFGGLAMMLMVAPDALWSPLPAKVRERLLDYFISYGHGPTYPYNWRYFNVMMLSFAKAKGRTIDESRLRRHLVQLGAFYAGDGWYRDGQEFDYYTAWVYQVYGPLWAHWFAEQNDPLAQAIHEHQRSFLKTYPRLFARSGRMIHWGRSGCYRCATTAPLPVAFAVGAIGDTAAQGSLSPGWARRICSGALNQFLSHPQFLDRGLPSLGLEGPYDPGVQMYSCTASPYWLGLCFLTLLLDADHTFWTAPDDDGRWSDLPRQGDWQSLDGPGLTLINRPKDGAAELLPGRVMNTSSCNNRLAYHSDLPWQADDHDGLGSASYMLKPALDDEESTRWLTPDQMLYAGMRDGVLYRQCRLPSHRRGSSARVDLAEFLVEDGVVRVDRPRWPHGGTWRLAHHALPLSSLEDLQVQEYRRDDTDDAARALVVTNGAWSLAVIILAGWHQVRLHYCKGLHPQSVHSVIPMLEVDYQPWEEPDILSAMLLQHSGDHRWDETQWFDYAVMPLQNTWPISRHDQTLATVSFDDLEGRLRG